MFESLNTLFLVMVPFYLGLAVKMQTFFQIPENVTDNLHEEQISQILSKVFQRYTIQDFNDPRVISRIKEYYHSGILELGKASINIENMKSLITKMRICFLVIGIIWALVGTEYTVIKSQTESEFVSSLILCLDVFMGLTTSYFIGLLIYYLNSYFSNRTQYKQIITSQTTFLRGVYLE